MAAGTVKSAARAVAVLEHFARRRTPLALGEVCAALGYPQSSASVLLKTLAAEGYLFYDRGQRRYFPTLRVAALGDWVAQAVLGRTNVIEALWDVRDETGEQTAIAIPNDVHLQFIRLLPPADRAHFHIDEGAMVLLSQSAMGWTLLSALPDRKAETLVRRARIAAARAAAPAHPITPSVADLMSAVGRVRRQGYGYAENTPFAGIAALAVALPIRILDQAAVLGLGGPLARVRANRERYLAILRRAAARVVESADATRLTPDR